MKISYADHFVLPLPAGHRFPMQKYALLRQRVTDRVAGAGRGVCVFNDAAVAIRAMQAEGRVARCAVIG